MRMLLGLLLVLSLGAQPRPLTIEEALRVSGVGEIAASNNSAELLYSVAGAWIALSDGKAVETLRGAAMLRWSPDGTRIAYFRGDALHVFRHMNLPRVAAHGVQAQVKSGPAAHHRFQGH